MPRGTESSMLFWRSCVFVCFLSGLACIGLNTPISAFRLVLKVFQYFSHSVFGDPLLLFLVTTDLFCEVRAHLITRPTPSLSRDTSTIFQLRPLMIVSNINDFFLHTTNSGEDTRRYNHSLTAILITMTPFSSEPGK
ncbi:hypothetical protein QBC35DRAFT_166276 [Podospora australis]|uniref:Uncharacterized protein n=1 Tax=Podospora australis TaxID=1536484 RepID=A0AAN6WWT5_9PEZI|nr:hypothetical protein QBC35DRAFT_166276 [Podospora australis]